MNRSGEALDRKLDRLRVTLGQLGAYFRRPECDPQIYGAVSTILADVGVCLEEVERESELLTVARDPDNVTGGLDLEGAFDHLNDQVALLEATIASDKIEPAQRGDLSLQLDAIEEAVRVVRAQSDRLSIAQAEAIVDATILAVQLDEAHNSSARAFERAQASQGILKEFLASVSHELRTPLHGILSFSRLASKKIDVEGSEDISRVRGYLSKIEHCGEVLLDLVNELLDLSRLERRVVTFNGELSQLEPSVDRVIQELEAVAEAAGVRLVAEVLDDAPVQIDAKKIEQVLRNLISNAIRFSPSGEEITVTIRREEDWLEVSCRDRGPGLTSSETERVFERFVSSNEGLESSAGTGLGLAIARQLVELHGGSIRATNHPDGGALFAFTIPLDKQEVEA